MIKKSFFIESEVSLDEPTENLKSPESRESRESPESCELKSPESRGSESR